MTFTQRLMALPRRLMRGAGNPFAPGAGRRPPHLAGREHEKAVLDGMVRRLAAGGREKSASPGDILIMYGPRGTGKTCLQEWFVQAYNGRHFRVTRVVPRKGLVSPSAFLRLLPGVNLAAETRHAAATDLNVGVSAKAGGVARMGVEVRGGLRAARRREHVDVIHRDDATLGMTLEDAIVKAGRPLALVVDEAHRLTFSAREWLLDLAQNVIARGAPFLLVLGGTPGLNLDFEGVSYAGRCERMPVDLIEVAGAADAIRVPLEERGIHIDDDALRQVVADSLCYPYFLQLWGRALWERARAAAERSAATGSWRMLPRWLRVRAAAIAGQRLTAADVEAARPAVDARRTQFYNDRYNEQFEGNDALRVAAVAVAEAYQDDPAARHSRARIKHMLGEALARWNARRPRPREPYAAAKAAKKQIRALIRWDFVWQAPDSELLRPGIPSFMTYTLQRHRRDNPTQPPPAAPQCEAPA